MQYELYHHGILGQRWGVRRFQNKDGSLTAAGRRRKGFLDPTSNINKGPNHEQKETFGKRGLHGEVDTRPIWSRRPRLS